MTCATRRFAVSVFLVVAFICSLPASAQQVALTLLVGGAGESTDPAVLTARPVTGPAGVEPPPPVSREGRLDQPFSLSLDPSWVWDLRLEADGWWAAPAGVQPGRATDVTVNVWPSTPLVGEWRVPVQEPMPEALEVRFGSRRQTEADGTVSCPVAENGRWSCDLPAVAGMDLRLRAKGFVSHYLWGVDLEPGIAHDVGRLTLQRGASLVGRVDTEPDEDGVKVPVSATVELKPVGALPEPEDGRAKIRILKTRADRRGFFHLTGIAPGTYRVVAEQPGFAPRELSPVRILADAETTLRDPLVLRPPATLAVELTPAVDAFGHPWSVELWKKSAVSGGADILGKWNAGENGTVVREDLAPGDYLVFVRDRRGAQLLAHPVHLEGGVQVETLDLPLVWVEGTCRLGKKPLSAEILFGGPFGPEQVTFPANEEGEFFGYLPRAGTWLVYVESETPNVRRYLPKMEVDPGDGGVARVEIRLPDTHVEGEVVDGEGRSVSRAPVRLYPDGERQNVHTLSDDEGRFTFHGLAEGDSRLVASHRDKVSDVVTVSLVEGQTAPWQRLVLVDKQTVHGRVVDPEGRPIPGVAVALYPFLGSLELPAAPPFANTGVDGSFEISLLAEADAVQGFAYAPGYALTTLPYGPVPTDELVLRPQPHAGALTLELDIPVRWSDPSTPMPVLWIQGVAFTMTQLGHWARINGEGFAADSLSPRVPYLPPGRHLICAQTLSPGQRTPAGPPPGSRCSEVQIQPLGEDSVRLKLGS